MMLPILSISAGVDILAFVLLKRFMVYDGIINRKLQLFHDYRGHGVWLEPRETFRNQGRPARCWVKSMESSGMEIPYTYEQIPSVFGIIGLIQANGEGGADSRVVRILLPLEGIEIKDRIAKLYPHAVESQTAGKGQISRQILKYLKGKTAEFSLNDLDLNSCGGFQQGVLRLEFQIPRGRVSTYGHLAVKLGRPSASRAVGTALARNLFPIVIPCHRTVWGDGTLGGFAGGLKMKRVLLEMEGIRFDACGRVKSEHFW